MVQCTPKSSRRRQAPSLTRRLHRLQIKNTKLQFCHCCYCPIAKAEKKEKVFLGGVQHADSRNLDLRIIPQKNTDRLKKFLWTTDWESLLEWTSPGEKTSLSSGTTHRNERCNKPTIKIENCLPITAHFFGVVCKKKQPKPNTLSWKRSLSSLGTKL